MHASGHGYREDPRRLLLLTRPRALIPVHGRYRMLAEHAEIARQAGVEQVVLPRNGSVIEVGRRRLRTVDHVTAGRIFVDGKGVGDVEEPELRDRLLTGDAEAQRRAEAAAGQRFGGALMTQFPGR